MIVLVIFQHQKGVIILGIPKLVIPIGEKKKSDRYTKIIRYPQTHKQAERDGVWQAPRRADKSGFKVMMRPTHGCIVLLKGADLPCVGGYGAGIEEQGGEGNHYLS